MPKGQRALGDCNSAHIVRKQQRNRLVRRYLIRVLLLHELL